MGAVSETLVREYFELNGFFVRQRRKHVAQYRSEDEEIDFFVWHPQPQPTKGALPFLLGTSDLACVARAVVVVIGWHAGRFSASTAASAPELFRFAEPAAFERSVRSLGEGPPPLKILVTPALPDDDAARRLAFDAIRAKNVDAIIPFPTVLTELIARVEANRNYQKSDVLQTLRILKAYDLVKDPQMELFKPVRKKKANPSES